MNSKDANSGVSSHEKPDVILAHTVEKKKIHGGKQPHKIVVSLWLDNYDNIFSDFDPRSYAHRELSDDFLIEAKKVTHEVSPGELDLTFLIPAGVRDPNTEKVIKERLHAHFKKMAHLLHMDYRKQVRKGISLVVLGVVFMMMATTFSVVSESSFWGHLLRVVFEPAGWFCMWTGLDNIFTQSKSEKMEFLFNKKMAHAGIQFDTYKA